MPTAPRASAVPEQREPPEVSATSGSDSHDIPRRLLQRLDDLGTELERRGDSLALIALGSVGLDLDRIDEHSDLDFFAVVEDDAKARYLESIDWLEALAPVAYSFRNSPDGRKVLFADGLFAEYAVFTLDELRASAFPPARIVWRRDDAPLGLERWGRGPGPLPHASATDNANEALTNLFVGLHREARGERLAAMRLIQVHAVDRLINFLELSATDDGRRQDPFTIERGTEKRFGAELLPLSTMVPGYTANREAAAAILAWLEERVEVDPSLGAAIRRLLR